MMAWALFCHDFDLSKGINILSEKCPVVLDHYIKKGSNFGHWFNRINRMSVDFLVCTKDFKIISAIELDDSTHNDKNRKFADTKKDKALFSADIRMIRLQISNLPDTENIKILIRGAESSPSSSNENV